MPEEITNNGQAANESVFSEPEKPVLEPETPQRRLTNGLIATIVLLSVIVGAISGFGGAFLYSKIKPAGKTALNQSQTAVVQEDSAIIDVVHKAEPAVVSIVISKNVSQLQSDNNPFSNPFFFDPFFGTPQQQSPKNSTPSFQEVGEGSGFFVTADGMILTNKHVVADTAAKYTVYTNDGKKYDATVLARDPNNDLALVKVNIQNAPTLSFADSTKLQIGQTVIAIGNSLGQYRNTVTSGIVSGIGRNITAGGEGTSEELEGVIQTDAAINPGNSGGPLLNIFGQVIGVNTAIDQQGQLLGFAIPALDAQKDLQSYQKYTAIKKPFLGVRYLLITPAIKDQYKLPADNGAWISTVPNQNTDNSPSVVPGSAADKAGIKDGDIITSVNGQQITQDTTLATLIKQFNPGDTVTLNLLRNGKQLTLSVVLGEQ